MARKRLFRLGRGDRLITSELNGAKQIGQLGLVVLALGDVQLDPAHGNRLTRGVGDRELHRGQGVFAATASDDELVLDRALLVHHLAIVCHIHGRLHVDGAELIRLRERHPGEIGPLELVERDVFAVDHDEPAVEITQQDHRRHVVDDGLEARLGTPGSLDRHVPAGCRRRSSR